MREAKPSRTALRVAMRRAAHQLFDAPRVLDDPLALTIVGDDVAGELRSSAAGELGRIQRALRAFMAVRSRFAEDELARAVERGVRQYVVLGAGLDTFAYRNPFPDIRVFEVDYPATQQWKRAQLAAGAIAIPPSVTFAPVDFERQTLADGLESAGFDRAERAFFSWLGVTMYLTGEAIRSTLAYVASTRPGGGIVFDYAVPRSSLGVIGRFAFDAVSTRVAAAGEPFQTFFDPPALRAELEQAGFHSITDLGREELNARYFELRTDGLRVSGDFGRLLSAQV